MINEDLDLELCYEADRIDPKAYAELCEMELSKEEFLDRVTEIILIN